LGDIAKAVYLSPTYLSSLITNETGKSFTDILNDVRIQNAIELMKDPKRKLSEIAISVGFNDPQYFSTIFKKHTGLTPRLYRELYLSGQMGIFQSLSGEKEDNE
jgi:two-component system response regulator YesN